MDATPTAPNRTACRNSEPGAADSRDEPSCAAMVFTGIEPSAKPRNRRPMPLRSAVAVATMSTRLSGSSTQSTGTSWIRRPLRSASTEQLGVEEPTGVCDMRQQALGDIGADGLEPALGVGEARGQRRFQNRVVAARDISASAPRTTRAPRPSRVPIARSEWPEISGATNGASAARSVDRSTSMYARTVHPR